MTDNGGAGKQSSNAPYSGGKTSVWEGGIHGDGFFSGPALSKLGIPTQARSNILFHAVDLLPTLAYIAGAIPPQKLDGVNQLKALRGQQTVRTELFLGYSHKRMRSLCNAAIREGPWKLIRMRSGEVYLFDLEQDKREKRNLAKTQEKITNRLLLKLGRYESDLPKRDMKEDSSCWPQRFGWTCWGDKAMIPWCDTRTLLCLDPDYDNSTFPPLAPSGAPSSPVASPSERPAAQRSGCGTPVAILGMIAAISLSLIN
jgi:hypothetical protein